MKPSQPGREVEILFNGQDMLQFDGERCVERFDVLYNLGLLEELNHILAECQRLVIEGGLPEWSMRLAIDTARDAAAAIVLIQDAFSGKVAEPNLSWQSAATVCLKVGMKWEHLNLRHAAPDAARALILSAGGKKGREWDGLPKAIRAIPNWRKIAPVEVIKAVRAAASKTKDARVLKRTDAEIRKELRRQRKPKKKGV